MVLRKGVIEEVVTLEPSEGSEVSGECGDVGCLESRVLSTSLLRLAMSGAAMVTIGMLFVADGWWLRNAKAEGLGMLRTEAFCWRTKEFVLIFGFS